MPPKNAPLRGLRRELTQPLFEELAALQCTREEILGYVGVSEDKLERWCRRVYRRTLAESLSMIRQDGLIAIRRASFDQLKKSATIISQQYNRFLPMVREDPREAAEAGIRALTEAMTLPPEKLRQLYTEPEEGGEEE